MVWAAVLWHSFGPITTPHGRITAKEYVYRLGNQMHPIIHTLFPQKKKCKFPRGQCLHSHSCNSSVMVWGKWKSTPASSMANTITRSDHHTTSLVSSGDYTVEQTLQNPSGDRTKLAGVISKDCVPFEDKMLFPTSYQYRNAYSNCSVYIISFSSYTDCAIRRAGCYWSFLHARFAEFARCSLEEAG
jgi:hypothetical protein